MLNADQLRDLIIKPTLIDLVMFSDAAVELLMFTCANESLGGTYLKQIKGPALGIYQMEPNTYIDIWQNYIVGKTSILMTLGSVFNSFRMPEEDRMIWDLRFATAMARIHYERVSEPLPFANDTSAIWDYYKRYYNTSRGDAEKDTAIAKYHQFIGYP